MAAAFSNNPFDTGGTGGGGGTGPPGPPGLPGTAATIAVGTVQTGTPLAISNTGTPNAAVLAFTIPAAEGVSISTNTPPAAPDPGDLWTTVDGRLYIFRSGFWVQVI